MRPTFKILLASPTKMLSAPIPTSTTFDGSLLSTKKMNKWMIFCLGTNNWQHAGEFAPGSGILHEAHHKSFQQLDSVERVVSLWPSRTQKSPPNTLKDVRARTSRSGDGGYDYKVFELNHDIPICESVSPVSSYRWHAMDDEAFCRYRTRLLEETEAYIDEVEAESQRYFNLFIAHHTFMNPVIMAEINRRRVEEKGKPVVPLVSFAHGTALKMYQHELAGTNQDEFPLRFYPMVEKTKIFSNNQQHRLHGVFVISNAQKEVFTSVWPEYPTEKVLVAPNGYDQSIFRPVQGATPETVLPALKGAVQYPEGIEQDVENTILTHEKDQQHQLDMINLVKSLGHTVPHERFDKYVLFTGRFADWKRLDVVLRAAKQYHGEMMKQRNNKNGNKGLRVATLIVGGGSAEDDRQYQELAFKELGLGAHTFFLGRQPHQVLARLNTIADVAVFPSKEEPFGLVFIEALGCGCPVIGAKSGGPMDIVHNGVGALVEEQEDNKMLAASVANTVVKALTEDWKSTKGPKAVEYAVGKYSLLAQCEEMLKSVEEHFV